MFVVVDSVVFGIKQKVAEFIGVALADVPTMKILDPADEMKKYNYDNIKDASVESIKQFVDDFRMKKLKPFLKSEAIPAEQGKEEVKVIVGKNF